MPLNIKWNRIITQNAVKGNQASDEMYSHLQHETTVLECYSDFLKLQTDYYKLNQTNLIKFMNFALLFSRSIWKNDYGYEQNGKWTQDDFDLFSAFKAGENVVRQHFLHLPSWLVSFIQLVS